MSDDATGTPARRAALSMVDAVLRRGQRFDALPAFGLPKSDEGLARAIAAEVFRRLVDLDALIDSATPQPLPADAKARAVLRIALVQVLALGTPPHAAISTMLPLISGGPKRLVHGVFGTLMRRGAQLPEVPTLPAAVTARWGASWGYAMITDAARALGDRPAVGLSFRDGRPPESVPPRTDVANLEGYAEGAFWVQNIAASLPARALGAGNGRTVLDLCAAPGGKTMQLAAAGWKVIAVESHARRSDRLRENLARTRLEAEVIVADVMEWEPSEPADAILLDAPCTATGIFSRHPDVVHRIGAKDIAALAALQGRMLARASTWLKPDAPLVYATCSVEPEEGESVVRESGLVIDPVLPELLPEGVASAPQGWVRVHPAPGRDGFFFARLKRP